MSSNQAETGSASRAEQDVAGGGAFLYEPVLSHEVFTPERFTDEHRQLRDTARDFMKNEVEPYAEELDHKKPGLMLKLMRKAADLGLFMVEVPEKYGGLGLDKVASMIISEALATVGSFAVTYGAHTGIGTLPLVYYGVDEQKSRYLPKLASGELLGAYALSEPGSGSDALSAKTVARLSDDGSHYVIDGTKQWITNAAWAHLFTIFAQVDGKLTAFLVERDSPGLSIGNEEHKLGIRGSSTCQVVLDEVTVPVANLLGEAGRGHKIAFNILNIGRWKLGIGSVGAGKAALEHGVRYAKQRKQFKKAIASFGMIRQKLAASATLLYAGEAMAYRLAGALDVRAAQLDTGDDDPSALQALIEDYTIEASVLKVFGSEALAYVSDEMLQVHGGNGYTEDYPLERFYRDARINRIFEGTNEINRLIVPATMLKRALSGSLPLMGFAQQVVAEIEKPERLPENPGGELGNELRACELCKRAVVYEASYAAQRYMADLKEKQRILGALADCITDVFGMDSVLCRATQAATDDVERVNLHRDLARLHVFEARANIFQRLRRIAMIMAEGEELDRLYERLGVLDQRYRVDYTGLQDRVAERLLQADGYAFR